MPLGELTGWALLQRHDQFLSFNAWDSHEAAVSMFKTIISTSQDQHSTIYVSKLKCFRT